MICTAPRALHLPQCNDKVTVFYILSMQTVAHTTDIILVMALYHIIIGVIHNKVQTLQ